MGHNSLEIQANSTSGRKSSSWAWVVGRKNPSHADLNNKRFEGTGEFRCKEALDFPAFSQKRKMFSGPPQRGNPANLPEMSGEREILI
jgi:hypothetical protein